MKDKEYKYDVAFSFLAEDEDLATKINDLLEDRLSTFLYSRQQGELAGTDGEKRFNAVFGEEARIIFVLYRKDWGSTPWTRIEENAIRNRAFDDGYDFVIFAPLDSPQSVPKYLPKNRLWVGLERWGFEGAASVIESRVQEAGGIPHPESIEEHGRRRAKELRTERDIKKFIDSEQGVKRANQELSKLFSDLKKSAEGILAEFDDIEVVCEHDNRRCVLCVENYSLMLDWNQCYRNTLDKSGLYFYLYKGRVNLTGSVTFPGESPKRLQEKEYRFELTATDQALWINGSRCNESFSSEKFAKHLFSLLFDQVQKKKKGGKGTVGVW